MNILVINSGSSSLKFKGINTDTHTEVCRGEIGRIGLEKGFFKFLPAGGEEYRNEHTIADHAGAFTLLLELLTRNDSGSLAVKELDAVSHRFVHGGDAVTKAEIMTPEIIQIIKDNFDLAPLHNPPALIGFLAAEERMPGIPHVGIFDTAFHSTIPEENYLYAIPGRFHRDYQIRKFGFHGASHRWSSIRTAALLGIPLSDLNSVSIHIGGGVSAAAIRGGISVDTSVGFGTNAGMSMGTRSGDIDMDVIFYLQEKLGMSIQEIKTLLYKGSGLLGMSEISSDMRDVLSAAHDTPKAELAIEIFAHSARRYIAGLSTNLEDRMDALVFTAGIGENSPEIRTRICRGLGLFGIEIDEIKNKTTCGTEGIISSDNSPVKVLVIPANEELMMAMETRDAVEENRKMRSLQE